MRVRQINEQRIEEDLCFLETIMITIIKLLRSSPNFFAVITLVFCASSALAQNIGSISFVQLLTNRSEYAENRATVEVVGYLSKRGAFLWLYMTEDHARIMDSSSAMLIHDPDDSIANSNCAGYVMVTGRVAREAENAGLYLINDISYIESMPLEGPDACWSSGDQ